MRGRRQQDAASAAPEVREPVDVPGVEYSTSEHAPGLKLFRCDPYRATITQKSCAARWLKAQEVRGDFAIPFQACRTCSIGACHAGRGFVTYSGLFDLPVCSRCGRGGSRQIGNRVCVSCYNRARELRIGRNGRGHAPIELMQRPLRSLALLVDVDGEVKRVRDRETSGAVESMVQVMRTTKGALTFGFAAEIHHQEALSAPGEALPPETSVAAVLEREIGPGLDEGEPAQPANDAEPSDDAEISRYRRQLLAGTALRNWALLAA